MRVKRYVAESIQEAIVRVKSDLGRDAIILHTKSFKEGGFLGFFTKRRFEVIAAIDENNNVPTKKKSEPVSESGNPMPLIAARNSRPAQVDPLQTSEPLLLQSLQEEIAELKTMIRQVAVTASQSSPNSSGSLQTEFQHYFKQFELAPEVIDYLLLQMNNRFGTLAHDRGELLEFCQQILAEKLLFSEPVRHQATGTPQIVALIGPTGVGKTTTIAKLAANFNLFEGKKVGLVTIDTYRIAAVEHLKAYGDIINLPVEVVYTPADLGVAIDNLQYCDVILIDTAGRSQHNQAMIEELQCFLNYPELTQILLVISATTRLRDMFSIAKNFGRVSYTHFVFTKLDETDCLGPIISLALKIRRPIAYLTTGQNVPDDIEVAKPERLTAQLFKETVHG